MHIKYIYSLFLPIEMCDLNADNKLEHDVKNIKRIVYTSICTYTLNFIFLSLKHILD